MSPRARYLRLALSALFVITAGFHVAAIVSPGLAPDSPPLRHAVFVLVNLLVAVGLLWRRPRSAFAFAFALVFSLLTLQQIESHGLALVSAFRDEGRIDWVSIGVLLVMPLTAYALLRQRL
jgi:hypothetical protein